MTLSSFATPFLFNGLSMKAIATDLFSVKTSSADKVLVIIRLSGGNDGLNTVIPLDQYSHLVQQRSNVLIPQNKLLTLNATTAFHPALTGMKASFDDGKLSIVHNVGYPEQNRSHFRSMDIWNTGMLDPNATTGWVGRYLDQSYPNFPVDYPNNVNPDPFAISMGYQVAANCQGLMANFSHTVDNPLNTYTLSSSTVANDGTYYGDHMQFLSKMIEQSNAYGARVLDAAGKGNTLSTKYDTTNALAMQLRDVAKLISGGLNTKIYVLNLDGFDTHATQVDSNDPTIGTHANLLKTLSDAITAFQDDLKLLGVEQRVAGMTYSEFGRQIASNASYGTDHGDAAPLFLFGSCISQSIIGSNPTLSDTVVDQAGIPMQIDFRDIYASILRDWFEVDATEIQGLFEQTVTFYNVFSGCSLGVNEMSVNLQQAILFPNPAYSKTQVRFPSKQEFVRISLIDVEGKECLVVTEQELVQATHTIEIPLHSVKMGTYFCRIQKASGNEVLKLIVVE